MYLMKGRYLGRCWRHTQATYVESLTSKILTMNESIFTWAFFASPVGILMSGAKKPSPFMSLTLPWRPFMACMSQDQERRRVGFRPLEFKKETKNILVPSQRRPLGLTRLSALDSDPFQQNFPRKQPLGGKDLRWYRSLQAIWWLSRPRESYSVFF